VYPSSVGYIVWQQLINQIYRYFSIPQTPDSVITQKSDLVIKKPISTPASIRFLLLGAIPQNKKPAGAD